jgi:hypothetical protein
MKLAVAVGSMVAGKRMQLNPRAIADLVSQQLQNNPQFKEIGDQLREDLRGVGKAASGALVERRLDALADRLHGRTAQVRDQLAGVAPDHGRDDEESEEPEQADAEASESEEPEAEEDESEEPEAEEDESEEPEAEEDESEEPEAEEEPRGKAAKKAPAKKGAAKKAADKNPAAKKTAAKKPAAKKTAAAHGVARSAGRAAEGR